MHAVRLPANGQISVAGLASLGRPTFAPSQASCQQGSGQVGKAEVSSDEPERAADKHNHGDSSEEKEHAYEEGREKAAFGGKPGGDERTDKGAAGMCEPREEEVPGFELQHG